MITITNNNETVYIPTNEAKILFRYSNIKSYSFNMNEYDWNIFKLFIEKQPKIPLHNIYTNIIPKPEIIINLGLSTMYDNFVYYKYIYTRPTLSLCKKLEIMLENNYSDIMDMLENNMLDICIDSITDEIDHMKSLYTYYYDNNIFTRFINLHTNWLPYDMTYFQLNETKYVYELYYLVSFNIVEASKIINNMETSIIYNFNSNNNKYTLLSEYKVYEMFIHMMEQNILTYTDKTQKKILTKWLKINSYEYTTKFNICNLHKIKLNKNIIKILSTLIINFSNIGYIGSTNDIDVFKILCGKLPFNIVHISLYKYVPLNILQLLNKPLAHITIDIYELLNHTPQTLEQLTQYVSLELKSINTEYYYTDKMYITMYCDYYKLLIYNPEIIINMLIICKNNFYLDLIILKIAIDNIKITNHLINHYINILFDEMINDEQLYLTGPDLCEIKSELKLYNINNTFLEELC